MSMLKVHRLCVYYGEVRALMDASIEVNEGEIVCIVGGNGSGKSTLLKGIAGAVKPNFGTVSFMGEDITGLSIEKIIIKGLAFAPSHHPVFPDLSIAMNLEMGAYIRKDSNDIQENVEEVYTRFPNLKKRRNSKAGLLSGGEQQMLTIARALMSRPKMLLLDEPSVGLSPLVMKEVFSYIQEIRDSGVTIIIVEQNARQAIAISNHGYVLANSKIVFHGTADELKNNEDVKRAYFGG